MLDPTCWINTQLHIYCHDCCTNMRVVNQRNGWLFAGFALITSMCTDQRYDDVSWNGKSMETRSMLRIFHRRLRQPPRGETRRANGRANDFTKYQNMSLRICASCQTRGKDHFYFVKLVTSLCSWSPKRNAQKRHKTRCEYKRPGLGRAGSFNVQKPFNHWIEKTYIVK